MREDPDVVLVGEMRDRDTFESVLRAAETGHLVFTTLHSSSAPGAIMRLLDLFPRGHRIMRQTLAANLVAVVCQNLVPGRPERAAGPGHRGAPLDAHGPQDDPRRRESRPRQVLAGRHRPRHARFHVGPGARLVREEWVDPKVAYEAAPNAEALRMAIKGIVVKQGTIR